MPQDSWVWCDWSFHIGSTLLDLGLISKSVNPIDRVADITWAGAECTGLVTPATEVQLALTPVMAVVRVDCKVDWNAEFAMQFSLQRIAALYQSLGISSEGQP